MKKMTDEQKKNAVAAASSSLGSAAGIVVGMAGVQAARAANEEVDADEDPTEVQQAADEAAISEHAAKEIRPTQAAELHTTEHAETPAETNHAATAQSAARPSASQQTATAQQPAQSQPQTQTGETHTQTGETQTQGGFLQTNTGDDGDQDDNVEVLSYQTVTDENGQRVEIAVIAIDESPILIADVDEDGEADLMAADENGNQQIDGNEIHDISDAHLAMQPLHDAYEANQQHLTENALALDEGPDYINDGNVADFA